jgi:hypothetical protein
MTQLAATYGVALRKELSVSFTGVLGLSIRPEVLAPVAVARRISSPSM